MQSDTKKLTNSGNAGTQTKKRIFLPKLIKLVPNNQTLAWMFLLTLLLIEGYYKEQYIDLIRENARLNGENHILTLILKNRSNQR